MIQTPFQVCLLGMQMANTGQTASPRTKWQRVSHVQMRAKGQDEALVSLSGRVQQSMQYVV